jgi:hypothetical protein
MEDKSNQDNQDHQNALVEISKKLAKTQKELGQDEMLAELMLERAKILDHFTMAYLADTGYKPSEIKLGTSMSDNSIYFFFEKKDKLELV